MQKKTSVTTIIPIYKVEAFIERCATTLLEQTLHEVEYIFVNDATPDHSIQILEEVIARYPERQKQVHIVHHEENKGLPAARNTGLALATGEYIFHCDSDDYVEPTMLEELYHAAKAQEADIVWCDWYLTFAENERYMKQPNYTTAHEALCGMLAGVLKYNVWNKLVRHSLYTNNNIKFPTGYSMGEDMTIIRLMVCAKQIAYVPTAFYHYIRTNTGAFTSNLSEKHLIDIQHNTNETLLYIEKHHSPLEEKTIAWFKLNIKLPFLMSNNKELFNIWKIWFKEANRYIFTNKQQSLHLRILQWLASKNQYWTIWIYHQLIHRLIYGVIYR